ncbi:MAG: MmcB family DNA repair protein [Pseudomonadota bacterium]
MITVPAADLCRGVIRMLAGMDQAAVTELVLANGRRADIAAVDGKGQITIVEIKSCQNDFRVDSKWPDYRPFCDRFFFAVSEAFPIDILPEDTGLIIADGFGAGIVREADDHPLPAARRKSVTLRFARTAATRLSVPHLSSVDAGGFLT